MNGRNAEKENKVKKEKKQYYFDYTLLFALLLLIGFGLIMIYSVSSYSAYLNYNGNAAFFLQKQLKAVGVGFVLMIVTGALLFAVHPAIHSIGISTLIGMSATILITYTLQPALFRYLMRYPFFSKRFKQ